MAKKANEADLAVAAEMQGYGAELIKRKIKLKNGINGPAMAKDAADLHARLAEIAAVHKHLAELVDGKNAVRRKLLAQRKRLREGIKGEYGGDSAEYQAFGGTRSSETK